MRIGPFPSGAAALTEITSNAGFGGVCEDSRAMATAHVTATVATPILFMRKLLPPLDTFQRDLVGGYHKVVTITEPQRTQRTLRRTRVFFVSFVILVVQRIRRR